MKPTETEEILEGIGRALTLGLEPCLALARISSAEQRKGQSLAHQARRLQEYAAQNGLHIVRVWEATETAFRTRKRTNFHAMLESAERFKIKHLVFKDTDRALRNTADLGRLDLLTEEQGITRHYYDGDTGQGRKVGPNAHYTTNFTEAITAISARMYSEQNSHKVKAAFKMLTEAGRYPGGAPWGYRFVGTGRAKQLEIDPSSSGVLSLIFELFDTGQYTVRELCAHLNDKGINTAQGKTWKPPTLHKLLVSPFYVGDFTWQDSTVQDAHPAYFPREKFVARLRRLKDRRNGSGLVRRKHLFRGFVYCAACDSLCTPERQRGKSGRGNYVYYRHRCPATKTTPYVREEELFSLLESEMRAIEYRDDTAAQIEYIFTEKLDTKDKAVARERRYLDKRLTQLRREKKRTARLALIADNFSPEETKELLADLDADITAALEQLKTLDMDDTRVTSEILSIFKAIQDIPQVYLGSTNAESKAKLVRKLGERLVFEHNGRKLTGGYVDWAPPYAFFLNDRQGALHPMNLKVFENVALCGVDGT